MPSFRYASHNQPIASTLSVFIEELYLTILLVTALVAFIYICIVERHAIKQVQPARFTLLFFTMVFIAFLQVLFIFFPMFVGMILQRSLYPWTANPQAFLLMGIASGIVGLIIIIQIARLIRLSVDGRHLAYWSIILLSIYSTTAFVQFGGDIAYFFAAPLLLFLISLRVHGTVWLLGIGGIGLFPLLSSAAPQQLTVIITLQGVTIPALTLFILVYVVSLPFIFYFAGVLHGSGRAMNTIGAGVDMP
jgi:hypothetical protein